MASSPTHLLLQAKCGVQEGGGGGGSRGRDRGACLPFDAEQAERDAPPLESK